MKSRDPQEEVRYHVEEALAAICHAIRTSNRREDFAVLIASLMALKLAEERVGR